MDLAGDGTQDIVLLGNLTGYYQREADGEWRNFQSFESTPTWIGTTPTCGSLT
jgi:hypothetical protein